MTHEFHYNESFSLFVTARYMGEEYGRLVAQQANYRLASPNIWESPLSEIAMHIPKALQKLCEVIKANDSDGTVDLEEIRKQFVNGARSGAKSKRWEMGFPEKMLEMYTKGYETGKQR